MNMKALPVLLLLLLLALMFYPRPAAPGRRRAAVVEDQPIHRRAPKPEWVKAEIIRLKALMPCMGCRKLAETFNRLHAQRDETVGKTYVSNIVRRHRYE